jgi:glycine betaine catabolism B
VLEFTVKAVGLVSNWLHGNVSVGFELPIQGIAGGFTCGGKSETVPEKILLLSAGSGITPMLSIARWLSDRAHRTDAVFLHSARSPQDIIARSELEFLATQNPRFNLRFTVTEPSATWNASTGRINRAMLKAIPDLLDRTVYVCGPAGFMTGVKEMLFELGLPLSQYQEESFGGAAGVLSNLSKTSAGKTTPTIEFAKSQCTVTPLPEESILAAGLRSGVSLSHGCRMGTCGVCKVKLRSGEVNYSRPPSALHGDQGMVLPCVACAVDRVVLEA